MTEMFIADTYVRFQGPATHQRVFGPAAQTEGMGTCIGCDKPFKEGDMTTLVPIGPGGDELARNKAISGRYYNARAVIVHAECAGIGSGDITGP